MTFSPQHSVGWYKKHKVNLICQAHEEKIQYRSKKGSERFKSLKFKPI